MDVLVEANAQLAKAWRLFAKSLPDRDLGELAGLTLAWGGVPYFAYNAIMLSGPVASGLDLEDRAARAVEYMDGKARQGIFMLCDEWIPEGVPCAAILERYGLTLSWRMTGMAAEELRPPARELPALDFRRVADQKTLLHLHDINSLGYGLPLELARASTGPAADWDETTFGYVAYVADEPVACAATFPIDARLYVGLVATLPQAQRRGYAEAVMRHSLEQASQSTGLHRTLLHASDAGLPIYLRMGYCPTAHFSVYTR
jgi:GNAT superfamily N-acetyltransferase